MKSRGQKKKQDEPLRVRKNRVALWLKLTLVQITSKRVGLEEGQRSAVKRRRLNETFGGTQEQVLADMGKILFESKAGADCKIKTGCGEVFDVHRCILAGKNESRG
jgi:hypothetical protein